MTRIMVPERQIVLAILQWLQAKHPEWCWIRCEPPSAIRAARRRSLGTVGFRPHQPEDAWGDGVADILGIGPSGYKCRIKAATEASIGVFKDMPADPIAFEVKSATGKQRESQKAWQARWEKGGGLYHVVRSVDEVKQIMETL